MSIFDDLRCAENQVDDREPEPAAANASEATERTCYTCRGFNSPVDGCALDAPLAKGEKPNMQATFDNCEKWILKEPGPGNASGGDGRAAHEVDLAECAQDIVTKVRLDYFVGESREYDGRYELTNDEAADYVLAAIHALEAKDREALNKIAMVGQGWALDSVHAYQMRDLALAALGKEKE